MENKESKGKKKNYEEIIKSELSESHKKNQIIHESNQNSLHEFQDKKYSESLLEILAERLKIFDIVKEFFGHKK